MTDEHSQRVARDARDEMWYGDVEGQFGQSFATSIPAQLQFTDDTDQDTERFHEELESRGMPAIDTEPARKATDERAHYDGEIIFNDCHCRMKVLVFRGGCVRIYPHDDYIPTEEQLTDLVEALEAGFGSALEHDPIDREAPA
jgi:hypothetical protein